MSYSAEQVIQEQIRHLEMKAEDERINESPDLELVKALREAANGLRARLEEIRENGKVTA